ncbi:hypothetical protein PR048_004328 [Dryococelus australis]|uniref:Uncharacterized protein n=1 Tax=Dryococelus australis TaxID=614101 RepID=A0ABQ9I655_9NEOP|nr:hypothetical protein PR048_004328 [Dryococelus australis]
MRVTGVSMEQRRNERAGETASRSTALHKRRRQAYVCIRVDIQRGRGGGGFPPRAVVSARDSARLLPGRQERRLWPGRIAPPFSRPPENRRLCSSLAGNVFTPSSPRLAAGRVASMSFHRRYYCYYVTDGLHSLTEDPGGLHSLTEDPGGLHSLTEDPDGLHSLTEDPDGLHSLTEDPDGLHSLTEDPGGLHSLTEDPGGLHSLTEDPGGLHSLTEDPGGLHSLTEDPASQKQFSDTHKSPYDRVKRCRERKINIKASERVNVDSFAEVCGVQHERVCNLPAKGGALTWLRAQRKCIGAVTSHCGEGTVAPYNALFSHALLAGGVTSLVTTCRRHGSGAEELALAGGDGPRRIPEPAQGRPAPPRQLSTPATGAFFPLLRPRSEGAIRATLPRTSSAPSPLSAMLSTGAQCSRHTACTYGTFSACLQLRYPNLLCLKTKTKDMLVGACDPLTSWCCPKVGASDPLTSWCCPKLCPRVVGKYDFRYFRAHSWNVYVVNVDNGRVRQAIKDGTGYLDKRRVLTWAPIEEGTVLTTVRIGFLAGKFIESVNDFLEKTMQEDQSTTVPSSTSRLFFAVILHEEHRGAVYESM